MKHEVVIMEILEAFDLLGSYRGVASLIGCSANTVRRYVQARDSGVPVTQRAVRVRVTDGFEDKIWELVDRSRGRIQAQRVHQVLVSLGYVGSMRKRRYPRGVIVHSDRGGQFRSRRFQAALASYEALGSMGRVGACGDKRRRVSNCLCKWSSS